MTEKELAAARRSWNSRTNNAQGNNFEGNIKAACRFYKMEKRAKIEKIAEPFRVTKTGRDGTFSGRFIASAEPDFQGTLKGGRSIVFEAKYTRTEKMQRSALTQEQIEALEAHHVLGAIAAVCIGIQDNFFFVPWTVWHDMKKIYGRQYITAKDAEQYRVRFTGAVMFLDYIHKRG